MSLLHTVSWYCHCAELSVTTQQLYVRNSCYLYFPSLSAALSEILLFRVDVSDHDSSAGWIKSKQIKEKILLYNLMSMRTHSFFCIFSQSLCKASVIRLIRLRGTQYFAFMTLYNPLLCSSRCVVPWLTTSDELQGSAANFPEQQNDRYKQSFPHKNNMN